MNMQKMIGNKQLENATQEEALSMLFCNLNRPTNEIIPYFNDLLENPQKSSEYILILKKDLLCTLKSQERCSSEAKNKMYCKRVKEWTKHFGKPSIPMLLYMSNFSGVSFSLLYDDELTPNVIKSVLDHYVIGQEDYKKQLSLAFYIYLSKRNQLNTGFIKSNLLIIGPSGSGKTYGIQILGKLFDLPIGIVHCNNLVQEGIVGPNISDTFTELYVKHNKKMESALIVFDEMDKLFQAGHYNGRVLNEMLNIIDDNGEISFPENFNSSSFSSKVTMPTNKMMFVFTGVFDGLEQVVKKRLNIGGLGFSPEDVRIMGKPDLLDSTTFEDLEEYGIRTELLGRIQNYTFVKDLTELELIKALESTTNSPVLPYKKMLLEHNVTVEMTNEGLSAIAKLAQHRHLGVRGLKSILYEVFKDDLPDILSESSRKKIVIDAAYVNKAVTRKY